MNDETPPEVSLREATVVWARIGLLSFGGPAAQIALMHRELVERRRWISDARFLHALNYCMLLPGPEAQQLAVYVGWLLHRTWGGLIAGLLFVLPGFLTILALSLLYVTFGKLDVVGALFFGLKAAVLAIVVEAVLRIGKRALKNGAMVVIAAAAFLAIHVFAVPFPLIVLGAATLGFAGRWWLPRLLPEPAGDRGGGSSYLVDRLLAEGRLAHSRPSSVRALRTGAQWLLIWWLPVVAVIAVFGRDSVLAREGVFFSQAAVVTFGGAYAVLAFVAQQVVENFRWITAGEMLDGLALAETTPGPLILVIQFVAFLAAFGHQTGLPPIAAGVAGSLIAVWVTFAPCFLWIFLGAPYVEALRGNRALNAALSAVTAAVVGVILNLALWFALHVVFGDVRELRFGPVRLDVPVLATIDVKAALLAGFAMLAMFVFKLGLVRTLVLSAAAGVALSYF